MIIISWSGYDARDEGGLSSGEEKFETDEQAMNFLMDNFDEVIEPCVYEAIKNGLTVYSDKTDEEIEAMEEETGMDAWDGYSLWHWMVDGGLEFELNWTES